MKVWIKERKGSPLLLLFILLISNRIYYDYRNNCCSQHLSVMTFFSFLPYSPFSLFSHFALLKEIRPCRRLTIFIIFMTVLSFLPLKWSLGFRLSSV